MNSCCSGGSWRRCAAYARRARVAPGLYTATVVRGTLYRHKSTVWGIMATYRAGVGGKRRHSSS